ncbi:ficolin-2-like [Culex pipiens pallens]|uniref:ficolin-2-like n=1 Tax=Culex pipiens pallens TaxID=42434 RepID=UPI0019539456|nr:ficolin-2-like [Culex pipiens pallens]
MIRLLNAILLIAKVNYSGANFIENQNIQNSSSSVSFSNLPRTCSLATSRHSGVQLIHPQPGFREPFEVFCDQDYEGGGWIVIQNRYDGSVHFYRDWSEYERGFGDLEEEMWLGLGKIHELTYSRRYELHVLLEDWEGIRAVARYSDFLVAGPAEKYMLRSLGNFSGNAGDSLREQLGMKFTTFNADNDLNAGNCAVACSTTQIRTNPPQTCSLSTNRHSGIQLIHPQPGFREPFEVFCDQEYEGGGWVVIQNRYEGSVHFYRGWNDYERGFGSLNGEFWLGLSKIHELTYSRRYELHVLLEDWEGIRAVARYDNFLVAGPEEKYMLRSLGNFSGNAGDSLDYHLGMKFTTFDADNDLSTGNCAVTFYGAWWYRACHGSNLNGLYMQGFNRTGMDWRTFRPDGYSQRMSRMMIRARN